MLLLRVSMALAVGIVSALWVALVAPGAAAAPVFGADPWQLCPAAIAQQEKLQAIPKHLLSAIALAESARAHPTFGKRMPWPWTVMAEGQGRYLPSKAAAIQEVRELQARGIRNIDVGCMQVNLYYHGDAFYSLDNAFDPVANVTYAGQFLRELYADSGSWPEAAGFYHSATPDLRIPYRDRVLRYWNEQQRLELAGTRTFGVGPLTSGVDSSAGVGRQIRSPAMLLSLADRRLNSVPPTDIGAAGPGSDFRGPMLRSPTGTTSTRPRIVRSDGAAPVRSLDEEAAFAARRADYLQELRRAIAEVKRSYAVRVARNEPVGGTDPE